MSIVLVLWDTPSYYRGLRIPQRELVLLLLESDVKCHSAGKVAVLVLD